MIQYNQIEFSVYKPHTPVYYVTCHSSWGNILLLTTEEGICGIHFLEKPLRYYLQLAEQRFNISLTHIPTQARDEWKYEVRSSTVLSLVVQGTVFQQRVWKALCSIPIGITCSYQMLAIRLGCLQSIRAVANAIAQNFIACLIPCHRIIRKNGQIGGYRWGVVRKKALLAYEKTFL